MYEGCFTSIFSADSSLHRTDYSGSDFQFSGAVESGNPIYLGHIVRSPGRTDAGTMAWIRSGGTVSLPGNSGPAHIRGS